MTTFENESPTEAPPDETRRRLIKRLALVAATGYLAPKAVMISKPWACDKASMTSPHGMSTSGGFCG